MKELSEASGVPVATIKFYLRERLLPAGERTHPNQSVYGDAHLRRLRLIRALIDVGGLSVAAARAVISRAGPARRQSIHDDPRPGAARDVPRPAPAHRCRVPPGPGNSSGTWWIGSAGGSPRAMPAGPVRPPCCSTFAALEQPGLIDVLEPYARAAESAARADLDAVAAAGVDRDSMVETAVIGMVVGEALTLHLRRMAQEHVSAPTHAGRPTPAGNPARQTEHTVIIRHRTCRHPLPTVGRSRAPTAVRCWRPSMAAIAAVAVRRPAGRRPDHHRPPVVGQAVEVRDRPSRSTR